MRGKDDRPCAYDHTDRITPAYAGKSTRLSLFAIFSGDHPRVCGEKPARPDTAYNDWGSPPRVRGKVTRPTRFKGIDGITPACAGKRTRTFCGAGFFGDHPRVCGEKLLCSRATRAQAGSPPRVRGKAVAQLFSEQFQRITPACAGKSAAASSSAMPRGDHPRVCGEESTEHIMYPP